MKYTVVLLPEAAGRYTVVVPALPGCVSYGDSVEQALAMAKEAIELYLESELAHGEQLLLEGTGTIVASIDVEVPASKVSAT